MFKTNIQKDKSKLLVRGKSGKRNLPLCIDKCEYILSYLNNSSYANNGIITWTKLNSQLLRDVIGDNYKVYLKHLIDTNQIDIDLNYKKGSHSRSFKLLLDPKGCYNSNNKFYDKCVKLQTEEHTKKLSHQKQYVRELQIMMFNQGIIGFNEDNKIVERKLKEWRNTVNIVDERTGEVKKGINIYNSQKSVIESIHNDVYCVTDKSGNRLYMPHNTLKGELVPYLRINGKRSVNIDIKNSQWQFLAIEMKENGIADKDALKFYKLCYDGKIYDYIGDKLFGNHKDARKSAKDLMLNFLYCYNCQLDSKKLSTLVNLFKEDFKSVYDYLYLQKSKGGSFKEGSSNFSKRLVMKESSIILEKIQYTLLKNGIHCFSTHDGLYIDANKWNSSIIIDDINIREWIIRTLNGIGIGSISFTNYHRDMCLTKAKNMSQNEILKGIRKTTGTLNSVFAANEILSKESKERREIHSYDALLRNKTNEIINEKEDNNIQRLNLREKERERDKKYKNIHDVLDYYQENTKNIFM